MTGYELYTLWRATNRQTANTEIVSWHELKEELQDLWNGLGEQVVAKTTVRHYTKHIEQQSNLTQEAVKELAGEVI